MSGIQLSKINYIITIESSIAAGKSELLKQLSDSLPSNSGVLCIQEPVDDFSFSSDKTRNLLAEFYKSRSLKAYILQKQVLSTYAEIYSEISTLINNHLKSNQNIKALILERSLDSIRLFMFANIEHYTTTEYCNLLIEYHQLLSLHAKSIKEPMADICIFIECPISVLKSRIINRARKGEFRITLEYLQKLEDIHRVYLEKLYMYKKRVILIDGTKSKSEICEAVKKQLPEIFP